MTHIIRGAQAEVLLGDPGSTITLLADPEHTSGRLTSHRSRLHAGSAGAPPHSHERSAELLLVLGGALDLLHGTVVTTLTAGDVAVVPPGEVHAFAPAAGTPAELLCVFGPGTERFEYFRLLDRAHRGEATWDEVAASGPRFDNHYAASATWAAR